MPVSIADDVPAHVQRTLWHIRTKQKWIKEQLHALHGGFPKDSAYDDPWGDAFGAPKGAIISLLCTTSCPLQLHYILGDHKELPTIFVCKASHDAQDLISQGCY